MKKNTLHKFIVPILAVLLISQAVTGLFLRDKISAEAFEVLHEGGGIVLVCLVALHFMLNFGWVKANFLNRKQI